MSLRLRAPDRSLLRTSTHEQRIATLCSVRKLSLMLPNGLKVGLLPNRWFDEHLSRVWWVRGEGMSSDPFAPNSEW